jgi:hypothetical protein
MNESRLDALLDSFDPAPGERRAVVRCARDLADSGRLAADRGAPLTAEGVVSELEDAPDGLSLAERWNWWMGALELAYGGYDAFRVDRYES